MVQPPRVRNFSTGRLALLGLLVIFVAAFGQVHPPTKSQPGSSPEPWSLCGFAGDPDSYGLGVRLGIYIQLLTSVIAYNFYVNEAAAMRGVNSCFHVAIFLGLVVITVHKRPQLYAVEPVIELFFCISGFLSTLSLSSSSSRPADHSILGAVAKNEPSVIGGLIRNILGTATCSYGVWYTFSGMDTMRRSGCGDSVFLFAPVHLYGWVRVFFKVVSIIGCVGMVGVVCFNVFTIARDLVEYVKNWQQPAATGSDPPPEAEHQASWRMVALSLAGIGVLIVAVELTLVWNHVGDVYSLGSTGQVFPVVIAVAGLLRLFWKMGHGYVTGALRWHVRG